MANKKNIVEYALDQRQRAQAAMLEARDSLLAEIAERITRLKGLGYNYVCIQKARSKSPEGAAPSGRICGFCGEPGHNTRTCKKDPKNQ